MRLVTRSDFDGLICAVILKEAGIIDEYKFVHPKDIQDGKVMITENDVLTNVPYWPGCGMWFDHHSSEDEVQSLFQAEFKGESRKEKSCARIVYEYYGGKSKYPHFEEMVRAVDKSDSGSSQYTHSIITARQPDISKLKVFRMQAVPFPFDKLIPVSAIGASVNAGRRMEGSARF